MVKKRKKLPLIAETLRALKQADLQAAQGGVIKTDWDGGSCHPVCQYA